MVSTVFIGTKAKLRWVDLERRLVRVPYKLRCLRERLLPVKQMPVSHIPPPPPRDYDEEYISERVNYYNKMDAGFAVLNQIPFLREEFESMDYYTNDMLHLLRPLTGITGGGSRIDYKRGDVTYIPPHPTIVRSRPIAGDNRHSVLLKLVHMRHFRFVRDPLPFAQKKNIAVWRGAFKTNPRRAQLVERYRDHPLCNVAGTSSRKGVSYLFKSEYMEISEQLTHKFIISLEGVDVATNLKWIMSSNSLCFAPKMKFETWFMEGKLIPDFHFVLLADDFSDLPEKIEHYTNHPGEAETIIANANRWVAQFRDQECEDYIGRRVLLKYFEQSGQLD